MQFIVHALALKSWQRQNSPVAIIVPFAWVSSSDPMILHLLIHCFRTSIHRNTDLDENLGGGRLGDRLTVQWQVIMIDTSFLLLLSRLCVWPEAAHEQNFCYLRVRDGTSSALSKLSEFRATTSTDLSEGCRKEAVIAGSSKEQDRKSTMLFSRTGSPWAVSPGLPGKCLYTDRSPSVMCLWDQWKEEISSKSSALCVHVPCILPHNSWECALIRISC